MVRILLLHLILAMVSLKCSLVVSSGGAGETTNGYVVGIIVDEDGKPAANTKITLIPSNFNPVIHGTIADSARDTTDSDGRYRVAFTNSHPVYNLEALHLEERTQCLLLNIKIDNDTVIAPIGYLQDPGAISIFVPDSLDLNKGYFCFKGTSIYKFLKDNEPINDTTYKLFFPEVSALYDMVLFYGELHNPSPIIPYLDSVNVFPNDTSIIDHLFNWIQYTSANSAITSNLINSIAYNIIKDELWIATDKGVNCLTKEDWKNFTTNNSDLLSNQINDLAVNLGFTPSNGKVWFATDSGAAHYHHDKWTVISEVQGHPLGQVLSVTIDPKGITWLGTRHNGLFGTNDTLWGVYDTTNGLPSNCIRDVVVTHDGTLWCATDRGVACLRADQWKTYSVENSNIYSNNVFCVGKQNATLWFGCKDGVSRFENEIWSNFTASNASPFLTDTIFSITVFMPNEIFFGTSSGVCRFSQDTWNELDIERFRPLKSKKVRSISKSIPIGFNRPLAIWFGTLENGVIGLGFRIW